MDGVLLIKIGIFIVGIILLLIAWGVRWYQCHLPKDAMVGRAILGTFVILPIWFIGVFLVLLVIFSFV